MGLSRQLVNLLCLVPGVTVPIALTAPLARFTLDCRSGQEGKTRIPLL